MVALGNGLPLALPGALATTRYVGATAAGAPATGTFALGDFVIDQSASLWVCTVAGSPGTWVNIGTQATTGYLPLTGGTLSGSLATAGIVNTGTITSTGAISTSAAQNIVASGNLISQVGSLDIQTAGGGLKVKEGSNAKQGTFVLAGAATTVVPNTSVTASSRIFLTSQLDGGTPGFIRVQSRIAGTSFTIAALATDTSTVAYEIFEPG